MISIGELIWVSFRPLIRLVICAACGFAITKADIFPLAAARGAGQIVLNIALPSLMFSKVVAAFTSDNVNALGPLVLVAVIYEVIGVLLAWIIKSVFWVPHRFRYGILVAGGWGNVGDIPTSVIMSITGSAPFSGIGDQNLAIAYISVFLLVYLVTLFPMGGDRWIAMDYVGPDVENAEILEAMRVKRKAAFYYYPRALWRSLGISGRRLIQDNEKQQVPENESQSVRLRNNPVRNERVESSDNLSSTITSGRLSLHVQPRASPEENTQLSKYTLCSPEAALPNSSRRQSVAMLDPKDGESPTELQALSIASSPLSAETHSLTRCRYVYLKIRTFFKSLFTPISTAIIIAFPIAIVPKLKALFVAVPGVDMPSAPDGQPPLAFIMDTTTFIGGASVPLGLICLGSALARLHVPRNKWSSLPLGAIFGLAISRMIIVPILGVLICEKFLIRVGLIPQENKVIRFVCIFFSCLPTATTQVYLTQVYSGTGTAEHLSAFLIPQYILMLFSITILTAYSINLIF
ncbi:auxin efflux carrier [Cyathus striatus]|nr:auxin efflux carrier [Cyathus striatus]